jgi:hypothetical protein
MNNPIVEIAKAKLNGSRAINSHAKALPPVTVLDFLISSYTNILKAAENEIIWTPAWISLEDAPIFSKGTINVIQGKAGVHKSRLAETLCSLLLSPTGKGDYLGFARYNLGVGYYVAYIDTERNTQEHYPAAVQRIRERAGLDKKADNGKFYPVSIKQVQRVERQEAVKTWIAYVRDLMGKKGVGDWGLFVVLDVVTDCVASFNREDETLALFDYLGDLCEVHKVTFLLIIHENPGSEKARGHTGTEAMNKADTQMQISYEAGGNGEDSDLIKIRFLKTRNAARPTPVYLQYSKDAGGLIKADHDMVNEHVKSRTKNNDMEPLIDKLTELFDRSDKVPRKELIASLIETFGWVENTVLTKVGKVADSKITILDKTGKKCHVVKTGDGPGKPVFYYLEPNDPAAEMPDEIPF